MSLIGKLNWYRPFIKNLSSLMAPLTEKLKGKPIRINWTENDTNILSEILKNLNDNIILASPDPNEIFIMYTDSSDIGNGAILKQCDKTIGIFSHKYNDIETNYSITEKEIYTIYLALEHFREILYGCEIKIKSDSKNNVEDKALRNRRISR